MEQYYKSFMSRQHPSEELIADTVSQMKKISEEGEAGKSIGHDIKGEKTFLQYARRWKYCAAIFIVVLLIAGGIWHQNTRVIYYNLGNENLSGAENDAESSLEKTFGEERNSYLGLDDSDYYIFDGDAELSEKAIGQGKITIQTGTVKKCGYQPLYRTKPQRIRGQEIYLGKEEICGEMIFFAAFKLQNKYYYLESEHVTESEMTAVIKECLKQMGKPEE